MTPERITELALASGFKLKTQPDGTDALNPYVFDFARALLAAPAAAKDAPPQPVSEAVRERVCDAVAEALGDAMDCRRAQSAWAIGTMSQDDFSLVAEDSDRVGEIAGAAIEALAKGAAL